MKKYFSALILLVSFGQNLFAAGSSERMNENEPQVCLYGDSSHIKQNATVQLNMVIQSGIDSSLRRGPAINLTVGQACTYKSKLSLSEGKKLDTQFQGVIVKKALMVNGSNATETDILVGFDTSVHGAVQLPRIDIIDGESIERTRIGSFEGIILQDANGTNQLFQLHSHDYRVEFVSGVINAVYGPVHATHHLSEMNQEVRVAYVNGDTMAQYMRSNPGIRLPTVQQSNSSSAPTQSQHTPNFFDPPAENSNFENLAILSDLAPLLEKNKDIELKELRSGTKNTFHVDGVYAFKSKRKTHKALTPEVDTHFIGVSINNVILEVRNNDGSSRQTKTKVLVGVDQFTYNGGVFFIPRLDVILDGDLTKTFMLNIKSVLFVDRSGIGSRVPPDQFVYDVMMKIFPSEVHRYFFPDAVEEAISRTKLTDSMLEGLKTVPSAPALPTLEKPKSSWISVFQKVSIMPEVVKQAMSNFVMP